MTSKHTADSLQQEIVKLEARRTWQEEDIKNTVSEAINSLKPANLIRNTFTSAVKSPGFGKNLLKGAAGLAAGLLSRKFFFGGQAGIVKKALGTVVELGVARVVANQAGKVVLPGRKASQQPIK